VQQQQQQQSTSGMVSTQYDWNEKSSELLLKGGQSGTGRSTVDLRVPSGHTQDQVSCVTALRTAIMTSPLCVCFIIEKDLHDLIEIYTAIEN
jgi:hypothetical protein